MLNRYLDEVEAVVVCRNVRAIANGVDRRAQPARGLDKGTPRGKLHDDIELVNARIRAKVEPPSRIVKRQFGHMTVRYRGLMKNMQQLQTLFALSSLWMMRYRLQPSAKGRVRLRRCETQATTPVMMPKPVPNSGLSAHQAHLVTLTPSARNC